MLFLKCAWQVLNLNVAHGVHGDCLDLRNNDVPGAGNLHLLNYFYQWLLLCSSHCECLYVAAFIHAKACHSTLNMRRVYVSDFVSSGLRQDANNGEGTRPNTERPGKKCDEVQRVHNSLPYTRKQYINEPGEQIPNWLLQKHRFFLEAEC